MNQKQAYAIFLPLLSLLAALLPTRLACIFAAELGRRASPRRAELGTVLANLRRAYPEDLARQRKAAASYLRNAGMHMLSTYLYRRMDAACIGNGIELIGREHLERARAQGQGVLILSAHQHHLIRLGVSFGLAGYRVSPVLMDPTETVPDYLSSYMSRAITDSQQLFGGGHYLLVRFAPTFVRDIYRLLSQGEIVISANDFPENIAPKRRVRLPFISATTLSCPVGTVEIALANQASFVSAFIVWQGAGRFRIEIRPIDPAGGVTSVMEQYVAHLRATVEQDPGGWEGWKWGNLFA